MLKRVISAHFTYKISHFKTIIARLNEVNASRFLYRRNVLGSDLLVYYTSLLKV